MRSSKHLLFSCCLMIYGLSGRAQKNPKADPPNILFIVVDDLNDWTTLFDTQHPIQTPNLKQLAQRGAFFTHAYASSPACNPSRASVMTGTRPHKTGIYGNKSNWRKALPNAQTLQQFFMDRGYYVAGTGKIFHHHSNWAFHDNASFNEFLMMNLNKPYPPQKLNGLKEYGSRNTDWGPWPAQVEETGDYKTAQFAIDFLQREHKDPFFLNVGIYKPHSPFFAPQAYFDEYPVPSLEMPTLNTNDWDDLPSGAEQLMKGKKWFWKGMTQALQEHPDAYRDFIQAYQACASFADDMVGRVIQALDSSPYKDNTIIVLWSDHGFHLGEKEHIEKFALWEKATHVPLIMIAPAQITPNTRVEHPVDLTVLYPSLVELCGFEVPDLDGKSVVPLLKGYADTFPPALMTYGKGNHAIRTQRWRYIQYADGSEELYDHYKDPHEWDNLAGEEVYKAVIQELKQFIPKDNAEQVADLR